MADYEARTQLQGKLALGMRTSQPILYLLSLFRPKQKSQEFIFYSHITSRDALPCDMIEETIFYNYGKLVCKGEEERSADNPTELEPTTSCQVGCHSNHFATTTLFLNY